ncbi:hypothetical protein C6Q15_04910 [Burkholderia multivorans]|uniref:Uncharacterized protein n=1 Tax=Burkholderia multivorans TaxID=87883 RepID=A0A2S9MYY9_9BURK|nr:hypothetical protein C6Q07_12585 [Burkholderia multivorans]PRF65012.1 hypothetical protein C6Q15_04910 [Burkholderia multivorans]
MEYLMPAAVASTFFQFPYNCGAAAYGPVRRRSGRATCSAGGQKRPEKPVAAGRRADFREISPCRNFPDSRYSRIPRNTIPPDFNPR